MTGSGYPMHTKMDPTIGMPKQKWVQISSFYDDWIVAVKKVTNFVKGRQTRLKPYTPLSFGLMCKMFMPTDAE